MLAGCSNSSSSKAGGESKPEAYPRGYVEDFDEPRTKLADGFRGEEKGTGYFSGRVRVRENRGILFFAFGVRSVGEES